MQRGPHLSWLSMEVKPQVALNQDGCYFSTAFAGESECAPSKRWLPSLIVFNGADARLCSGKMVVPVSACGGQENVEWSGMGLGAVGKRSVLGNRTGVY